MLRRLIDLGTNFVCWTKRNSVVDPKDEVVKVNMGSGLSVAAGWTNVDASMNVFFSRWPRFILRMLYRTSGFKQWYSRDEYCNTLRDRVFVHHNVKYGIPFPDQSVDYLYSSHLLEHLLREDAKTLLKAARRVLKKGGVIRTCVPDLEYPILLYQKGDREEAMDCFFTYFSLHDHKYMYDFDLLKQLLEEVGFTSIERCSYREGKTPDVDVLDNRPEGTLYVEASK